MKHSYKDCGLVATFIFRYRPLGQCLQLDHVHFQLNVKNSSALLQANGIAPLATPPVPVDQAKVEIPGRAPKTDVKVELSDEDDDDIPEVILEKERALIVRSKFVEFYSIVYMCQYQAELEQVRLAKRAANSKHKLPKQKIKNEPAPFVPGEIIDLTL